MSESFTFTLDEESEKRLMDLLTDIDTSITPSFTIKDKHGNTAKYVKVIECKDCPNHYRYSHCYFFGCKDYCAWADREDEEE